MSASYKVIGLMSGTSLDGLDIVYCEFTLSGNTWTYTIHAAETIRYRANWKKKLGGAHKLSGEQLCDLDRSFGRFIGEQVREFIGRVKVKKVNLLASHGHTVFHQPEKGFTLQIGSGAAIAATTGILTVCDFRSGDVALGGQGAPLVPIGDKLLFAEFHACLNIGGIANISFERNRKRVAFDVCPANLVFNHFAQKKRLAYDTGGKLASTGRVNWSVLNRLNTLPFYGSFGSKSLGREWIGKYVLEALEKKKMRAEDALATASEHAAIQLARAFHHFKIKNALLTGGGTYNTDLLNRVKAYSDTDLLIPGDLTIQFKEALIFALLGVLRVRGEVNCLKEVTGASRDSVGGAVYF